MGLIRNEAITNSIKYAFDKDGGEHAYWDSIASPGNYNIKDNGKGFPPDFSIAQTSSLGMEIMKALSKQLGCNFEIKSIRSNATMIIKIENKLKVR